MVEVGRSLRTMLTVVACIALVAAAAGPAQAQWHRSARLDARGLPPEVLRPVLVTNGHGRAIVAWTCVKRKTYPQQEIDRVCIRVRSAGGHWHASRAVSAYHGAADSPQVAMNRRGEGVVVWSTDDWGGSVITRRIHRDGRLGPHVYATAPGRVSSVAIDNHGDVVLATHNYQTGAGYVSAQRPGHPYEPAANFGTPYSSDPHVAMTPAGEAMVVWGSGYEVDAREVHLDGTLGDLLDLSGSTLPSMADDVRPTFDRNGNLVVLWYDGAQSSNEHVVAVRRSAAGVVGAPQVLTGTDTDVGGYASAVLPDGSIELGWLHGIWGKVFTRRVSPTGELRPKQRVATRAAYLTLAAAPDDTGVLTWGRALTGSRLVGHSARIWASGRVGAPQRMPYTEGPGTAHLVRHRYLDLALGYSGFLALNGP
jgi:hypothetical protein